MKFIYIAGLEHSGSTLTDRVLSLPAGFIGLGEAASFFSKAHMTEYMARWGDYPDVNLCSCGSTWEDCEFWGEMIGLSGLESDAPLIEKYAALVDHIRSTFGEDTVVVDSSKSLSVLNVLHENRAALGLGYDDLLVVATIKDVRSFAMSIVSKAGTDRSFLSLLRTFNWWLGSNRQLLDYLQEERLRWVLNLYEKLCTDADQFVQCVMEGVGVSPGEAPMNPRDLASNDGRSHVAMGNKDFVLRNSRRIRYDSRWYTDDAINLAYLVHWKGRSFNKLLYRLGRELKVRDRNSPPPDAVPS